MMEQLFYIYILDKCNFVYVLFDYAVDDLFILPFLLQLYEVFY